MVDAHPTRRNLIYVTKVTSQLRKRLRKFVPPRLNSVSVERMMGLKAMGGQTGQMWRRKTAFGSAVFKSGGSRPFMILLECLQLCLVLQSNVDKDVDEKGQNVEDLVRAR